MLGGALVQEPVNPSWETIPAPWHIFLMLCNPFHSLTVTEVGLDCDTLSVLFGSAGRGKRHSLPVLAKRSRTAGFRRVRLWV